MKFLGLERNVLRVLTALSVTDAVFLAKHLQAARYASRCILCSSGNLTETMTNETLTLTHAKKMRVISVVKENVCSFYRVIFCSPHQVEPEHHCLIEYAESEFITITVSRDHL